MSKQKCSNFLRPRTYTHPPRNFILKLWSKSNVIIMHGLYISLGLILEEILLSDYFDCTIIKLSLCYYYVINKGKTHLILCKIHNFINQVFYDSHYSSNWMIKLQLSIICYNFFFIKNYKFKSFVFIPYIYKKKI